VNQREHDESWRVVVFTTSGEGGAYSFLDAFLRKRGHRIVGVVTTPGPRWARSADYLSVVAAAGPGVEVIVSTRPKRWAPMVATMRPDLIISAAFPLRIPADVIALPRLGAINGHDALLPKYRGPNPQGWVFRNGDTETGYTVHRLVPEFDAGPILAQVRVPVTEDDDFGSLVGKLTPHLSEVFGTALDRVSRGEEGESQDESAATPAPFFEESWRRIDWSQPARVIHNQVRSLIELPGQPAGAVAEIEGQRVRVTKTGLISGEHEPVSPGADTQRASAGLPQISRLKQAGNHFVPGWVIGRDEMSMVVMCGDGPLRIIEWVKER
jgi:methionyl-tRNA formyltransferase